MIKRLFPHWILAAMAATLLAGCIVHERVVVREPPCPRGLWIEGHYDAYGRWHPSHWQCPAVVVVH